MDRQAARIQQKIRMAPAIKKMNIKKFVTFILLLPACGLLTNMQSGSGGARRLLLPFQARPPDWTRKRSWPKPLRWPFPFVQNAGRFAKEVRYSADLFSGRFFLTDKELVYSLRKRAGKINSGPDRGLAFNEFFIDDKRSQDLFRAGGRRERG